MHPRQPRDHRPGSRRSPGYGLSRPVVRRVFLALRGTSNRTTTAVTRTSPSAPAVCGLERRGSQRIARSSFAMCRVRNPHATGTWEHGERDPRSGPVGSEKSGLLTGAHARPGPWLRLLGARLAPRTRSQQWPTRYRLPQPASPSRSGHSSDRVPAFRTLEMLDLNTHIAPHSGMDQGPASGSSPDHLSSMTQC